MTTPISISPDARLRDDLNVVEIDGDLVVFDPIGMESHVLSGGAVVVWEELHGRFVAGLKERIAERLGGKPANGATEIGEVLQAFVDLGLFDSTTRGDRER